jgi:hypothetical protein
MDPRNVLSALSLANYLPTVLCGIALLLSAGVGSAVEVSERRCRRQSRGKDWHLGDKSLWRATYPRARARSLNGVIKL